MWYALCKEYPAGPPSVFRSAGYFRSEQSLKVIFKVTSQRFTQLFRASFLDDVDDTLVGYVALYLDLFFQYPTFIDELKYG